MQDATVSLFPALTGGIEPAVGDLPGHFYSPTCRILTPSASMRGVLNLATKIAPTDSAVLIRGEPGVGKETIAREIHRRSGRAKRPLVRVACGAIREEQLDEQLFGREGYRVLDAESPCPGLLGQAHRGTLLLKGVSDLPFWAQVKLLDILQQNDYPTAQGHGAAPLDVRVIATTVSDLAAAVARGGFHGGLYYYLNVVEMRIPPLRERPEDIRPLGESFLARMTLGQRHGPDGRKCRLSEEAWNLLSHYEWPGNVRELASVIAHAAALADGQDVAPQNLAELLRKAGRQLDCETISVPMVGGLKQIERWLIAAVIERCRGNKAAAARVLGLHRRTLYRMMDSAGDRGRPTQTG